MQGAELSSATRVWYASAPRPTGNPVDSTNASDIFRPALLASGSAIERVLLVITA